MASFTKEQIKNAKVRSLNHWNSKGGWNPVNVMTMPAFGYIQAAGIYEIFLEIDGLSITFIQRVPRLTELSILTNHIVNGEQVTEEEVKSIQSMINDRGYNVSYEDALAFIRKIEKYNAGASPRTYAPWPSYWDACNRYYPNKTVYGKR